MVDTMTMDKPALIERAKEQMQRHLGAPDWSLREKVALTCRILFAQGHDSGLAGQITARAEQSGAYYTQRLGLGFDEITAGNLLRVDDDLNVQEGAGMPNPANRFHSWIYRARPDVRCIIHTHPIHVSALSMLGRPLKVAHMDACMLYEDVAFLPQWPGVPVGNGEGELISAVLGDKRAALLAHHGLVIACATIEEACMMAMQCERAARLQLLAESAGDIVDVAPALAREAHDWILQDKRSQAGFAHYARRILRDVPADLGHPLDMRPDI
ncbi:aldolase [Paludibacterium purpuratum]|uniref:L-fuculose-phosphate aldolase n=1 Tax=Paludibacterium purpuratum TaxID=1144873 RepID=A0A4R7B518_9NEIS|nr:aldolase [Paludibacterium purpuratum]TDR79750.1 L-fuculose-phosphate aldolase [Paludibacterium purpuratum]